MLGLTVSMINPNVSVSRSIQKLINCLHVLWIILNRIWPIFNQYFIKRKLQFGLLFGTLCKQSYRSWLQTQNCSCWLFTSPSFDVCRILVNGDAINGLLLSGRDQQFSQRDSGPLRLWTTGIPCRTLLCCEVVQWLDDVNGRGSSTVCINEFVLL